MPWTSEDAERHTKKADNAKRQRMWAEIANSVLAETGDDAASLVLGCSGSPATSNKIIQKGLAFSRRQSGTVPSSGRWLRFGILPRRLDSRGGASVVAAMVAAKPKEIPMTKAKSKRTAASRANDSKTKTSNSVKRT